MRDLAISEEERNLRQQAAELVRGPDRSGAIARRSRCPRPLPVRDMPHAVPAGPSRRAQLAQRCARSSSSSVEPAHVQLLDRARRGERLVRRRVPGHLLRDGGHGEQRRCGSASWALTIGCTAPAPRFKSAPLHRTPGHPLCGRHAPWPPRARRVCSSCRTWRDGLLQMPPLAPCRVPSRQPAAPALPPQPRPPHPAAAPARAAVRAPSIPFRGPQQPAGAPERPPFPPREPAPQPAPTLACSTPNPPPSASVRRWPSRRCCRTSASRIASCRS
jgi:hypothetical protein